MADFKLEYKYGDLLVDKECGTLYSFISVMGTVYSRISRKTHAKLHVRRIGASYTMPIADHRVKLAEFAQTELYKALNGVGNEEI
jgi:hypothetical protein